MPAWKVAKVKSKNERKKTQQVVKTGHFATLMDVCYLKNSELEPKFQNIRRSRRALR